MKIEQLSDITGFASFKKTIDEQVIQNTKWLVWHTPTSAPQIYTFDNTDKLKVKRNDTMVFMNWRCLENMGIFAITTSPTETMGYAVYSCTALNALLFKEYENPNNCILLFKHHDTDYLNVHHINDYLATEVFTIFDVHRSEVKYKEYILTRSCLGFGVVFLLIGCIYLYYSNNHTSGLQGVILFLGGLYLFISYNLFRSYVEKHRKHSNLSITSFSESGSVQDVTSKFLWHAVGLGCVGLIVLFLLLRILSLLFIKGV